MSRSTVIILLVLPFLIFAWMAPFFGELTISHDYVVYPIGNQLELQFALASGEWPLFVPGFAGGAPAPALMLGQLYHPISHLAAALPGYWSGFALEWGSALRVLSLGLTHLALFAFLRRLGIAPTMAFGVSFVTLYNLRMLDLFRYAASLEGYTATLLLCTSLAWYFAEPSRRLGPAAIALATALLLVSGHPQISYYGLLAAAIVWGLAPSLVRAVAPALGSEPRRYRVTSAGSVLLGVGIAAVFWLPLQLEFISANAGRFGQSYGWSTNLQTSWLDLARSFSLPLAGDVHAAFAGSALALVALLVPVLGGRATPRVVWGAYLIVLVVLLYSLGDETPVHHFVWSLLPGQSSMRVPGRATMLLPVLFFWILAWRFRADQPRTRFLGRDLHGALPPLLTSGVLSVALATALWSEPASHFAPLRIREIPDSVPVILLACGIVAVVALAVRYLRERFAAVAEPVFLAVLVAQAAITIGYGTWVGPKPAIPTFADLQAWKERSLDYPGAYGYGMYSAAALEQLERTFLQPELARLYAKVEPVASREAAWGRIAEGRARDVVVIEGPALGRSEDNSGPFSGRVRLLRAGFNRNVFEVRSNRPVALVVAFAHSTRWRATLDASPIPTYRANGYETAVLVPAGLHSVELAYTSPATRIGGLISVLALVSLGLWCALGAASKGARRAQAVGLVVAAVVIVTIAGFTFDGGSGLGTRHEWRAPVSSRSGDLAFGRPTRSSPVLAPENLHTVHASLAVDGSVATAFVSSRAFEPWWEVELVREQPIARVRLLRPEDSALESALDVVLTDDRGVERVIAVRSREARVDIPVAPVAPARTIRVVARGDTILSLKTVQVFGVEPDSRGLR